MPGSEPTGRETLALVFGASSFRRAPKLSRGQAFYNSAHGFHDYLTSLAGLGLPWDNVFWLFDDSRSQSDQLQDIREFLESRSDALKRAGLQPRDLIVYYVGHGLFAGADHAYCFAVRTTDERNEGPTSIRASDLAGVIKASARFLRKFLILDCCFSAAAYKEFQSGPLTASRVKFLKELPQRGTALLCSASAQDPSLAPEGLSCTMFSNSLLRALREGHPSLGSQLSLNELGELIRLDIQGAYPDTWVRPEIHSPDQKEGDIANLPLFPNQAHVAKGVEEEHAETQQALEEDGNTKNLVRFKKRTVSIEAQVSDLRVNGELKAELHKQVPKPTGTNRRKGRYVPLAAVMGMVLTAVVWLVLKMGHQVQSSLTATPTPLGQSRDTSSPENSSSPPERGRSNGTLIPGSLVRPPKTPSFSRFALVADNFRGDPALRFDVWTTGTLLLRSIAETQGLHFIPTQTKFAETGLTLSGTTDRYQFTGIQSRVTVTPPFSLRAAARGNVANGNAIELYLVSSDLSQYLILGGNLNPANIQYHGMSLTSTGDGPNLGREKAHQLKLSPDRVNVGIWYVITVNLDANGNGGVTVKDLGGNTVATEAALQVGRGPFYGVLGQSEGWPVTLGRNEGVWAWVEVRPDGIDGVASGSQEHKPDSASDKDPVPGRDKIHEDIRTVPNRDSIYEDIKKSYGRVNVVDIRDSGDPQIEGGYLHQEVFVTIQDAAGNRKCEAVIAVYSQVKYDWAFLGSHPDKKGCSE